MKDDIKQETNGNNSPNINNSNIGKGANIGDTTNKLKIDKIDGDVTIIYGDQNIDNPTNYDSAKHKNNSKNTNFVFGNQIINKILKLININIVVYKVANGGSKTRLKINRNSSAITLMWLEFIAFIVSMAYNMIRLTEGMGLTVLSVMSFVASIFGGIVIWIFIKSKETGPNEKEPIRNWTLLILSILILIGSLVMCILSIDGVM